MSQREVCITTDPYCYDDTETNDYNIAAGYSTANDWIAYQDGGHVHTPAFKSLRVNSFNYTPSRDVINEESFDNVAPAYVIGGMDNLSGSFEAN